MTETIGNMHMDAAFTTEGCIVVHLDMTVGADLVEGAVEGEDALAQMAYKRQPARSVSRFIEMWEFHNAHIMAATAIYRVEDADSVLIMSEPGPSADQLRANAMVVLGAWKQELAVRGRIMREDEEAEDDLPF